MENFTPIRNGLLEHIRDGRLCPFDLGIYTYLHLTADWETGICFTNARAIAVQFGGKVSAKDIRQSLYRQRQKRYINYRDGDGSRGCYNVLIHKSRPTVGSHVGLQLNAFAVGSLDAPVYEPYNSDTTVNGLSDNTPTTVKGPIQDIKTLQDSQEVKETTTTAVSQQSSSSDNSSSQVVRKRTRRTKATILSAYSQNISDVVNQVLSSWPTRQPNDDKIHADVAALAARVDHILRDNDDASPELLIRAAEKYLSEPKKFRHAPQYFFGPGNGTEAPWVAYARMIVHQASKSEAVEAVQ